MIKWKIDENKELPVAVIEDTEDGFGICTLEGGGTASREELEKTAQLIAAAPELKHQRDELLDACKNALADLEGILPEYDSSGERQHPDWLTIAELRTAITNAEK